MLDSGVLETAIGLAFIFALLSLTCSVLTESIARFFNMRGVTLKRAIRQLVYGIFTPVVFDMRLSRRMNLESSKESQSNARRDIDDFYNQGLIKPLYKTAFVLWKNSPSYIAPRTFALALVDKILDYHDEVTATNTTTGPQMQPGATSQVQDSGLSTLQDIVNALPPNSKLKEQFQYVLTQRDLPTAAALEHEMQARLKQLEAAVDALEIWNPQLNSALKPLLSAAKAKSTTWEQAYDHALAEIEGWFSSSMDRVTGWYVRQTRMIIFIIALLITLLFNVDTLAIANALYTNSTLRQAVVAAADQYIKASPQQSAAAAGSQDTPPSAASTSESADNQSGSSSGQSQPSLTELQATITGLGIPLGWSVASDYQCQWWEAPLCMSAFQQLTAAPKGETEVESQPLNDPSQTYPIPAEKLGEKLAGLALTVIALLLGAPFWFDLLKQFVNIRSTGAVPNPVGDKS